MRAAQFMLSATGLAGFPRSAQCIAICTTIRIREKSQLVSPEMYHQETLVGLPWAAESIAI